MGRNFQHLEVIDRLVLNAHRPKGWGLDQESAEPDRNGKFCGRTGTTIAREGRARNAEHGRTQQQKRTRAPGAMGNVATTPEDWEGEEARSQQQQQVTERSSSAAADSPSRLVIATRDVEEGEEELRHTPSITELKEHMDAMRHVQKQKFARGVLFFSNFVSFVFAILLVYYGATGRTNIDLSQPREALSAVGEEIKQLGTLVVEDASEFVQHGYIKNIINPYQLVLALGVALMILSTVGLLGTSCPARRVGKELLFSYFSTVLVFVCVLMWGAVMCFQYQTETQRLLEREVDLHWRHLRPLLPGTKKDILATIEDNSNLVLSGAFCVVSAVIMTVGLWSSSKVMGHYFTMAKVMHSCSVSGIFSGIVLVSLSVYYGAKGIGGQWAPGITAVSGVAIVCLSMLGIYGTRARCLLAMVLHLVFVCVLSLFVSVSGVFVIAYPHVVSDLVHDNWRRIAHDYTGVNEKHFRHEVADNLFLLGSASVLFGVLLLVTASASFATCMEIYHRKRAVVLNKIEICAGNGNGNGNGNKN